MTRGSKFENDSFRYLQERFSNERVTFTHFGGADSTVPDIKVEMNNKPSFYIEAKMPTAQSGQFVIAPDVQKEAFNFSSRNKSEPNEISSIILEYINKDFEGYMDAGTKGKAINLNPEILASWIINYYKSKKVKYIITYINDYVIFPLEKYGEYFTITATARRKSSGSHPLSKIHHKNAKAAILKIDENAEFNVDDKNTLYVTISPKNLSIIKSNKYIDIEGATLYLSPQENNTFKVRRISQTKNLTVIFNITTKKSQSNADLDIFLSELK